jgi:hypothetical protein
MVEKDAGSFAYYIRTNCWKEELIANEARVVITSTPGAYKRILRMSATGLTSDTAIWLQMALAGIFNQSCQALWKCRRALETGLLKPSHWSEDFMVLSQTKRCLSVGLLEPDIGPKPANFATHEALYIRCPATFKNTSNTTL